MAAFLDSNESDVEMDRTDRRPHAVLKELRGKSFTIGWAAAVLVATAYWLYFIMKTAWFVVSWFFG
jgi:hypothetical protein